jgi:hypothetical protein
MAMIEVQMHRSKLYKGQFHCPGCRKIWDWRNGLYRALYPKVKANVMCGRCAHRDALSRQIRTWVDEPLITLGGEPFVTDLLSQ